MPYSYKILSSRSRMVLVTAFFAFSAFSVKLDAALLAYESFDYGQSSSNLNLVSESQRQTGLGGTWNSVPGYNIPWYNAGSSLSFGSLQTFGGHIAQSTSTANGRAKVPLGVDTKGTTGTIYLSYLFRAEPYGGAEYNPGVAAYVSLNSSSFFGSSQAISDTSGVLTTDARYSNIIASSGLYGASNADLRALQASTTYMVITEFTNVGLPLTGGNPGVATMWVLTSAQYDYFITSGATTEALNAASIGSDADSVFSRGSAPKSSGTWTLAEDASLTVYMHPSVDNYSASVGAYFRMDEIRLATTLSDALTGTVVIPEPSAVAFGIGVIALVAAVMRRRRS